MLSCWRRSRACGKRTPTYGGSWRLPAPLPHCLHRQGLWWMVPQREGIWRMQLWVVVQLNGHEGLGAVGVCPWGRIRPMASDLCSPEGVMASGGSFRVGTWNTSHWALHKLDIVREDIGVDVLALQETHLALDHLRLAHTASHRPRPLRTRRTTHALARAGRRRRRQRAACKPRGVVRLEVSCERR